MEDPDSVWEMPSEAEFKILQARQDRRDKISSLIGEYLLKGYAMLSSVCVECGTILLRDKDGRHYCVACAEVDTTECAKDDPALNREAARRRAVESHFLQDPVTDTPADRHAQTEQSVEEIVTERSPLVIKNQESLRKTKKCVLDPSIKEAYARVGRVVLSKMEWAAQQLQNSPSTESSINLCALVKMCAETLSTLQNLQPFSSNVAVESVSNPVEGESACTSSTHA